MKKILLSLVTISAVAIVAVAASDAFFSDDETSVGNTFVAGSIDLKIDNESYVDQGLGLQPREDLTWGAVAGAEGNAVGKFFDILDMKPGDNGEDTISIHLTSNPAWVCVDLDITANSDETCTEPESADDSECVVEQLGTNGDLAKDLHFAFWKDDGDNVYEVDEIILTQGPVSGVLGGVTWALADSLTNQGEAMQPTTNTPHYIGKAWCYGTLTMTPVAEGVYANPTTDVKGYTCDGSLVGNEGQTDKLVGDITFRAVQSRHNDGYVCTRPNRPQIVMWHISLENKDDSWKILSGDQIFGDLEYSNNDTTFHGTVIGTGLAINKPYQITLNSQPGCNQTGQLLALATDNRFISGYWNGGPNLESICGTPGEGIYNMDLTGNATYPYWYTVRTDNSGAFVHNFDLPLPSGNYSDVKVLVKQMLDPFISPWAYLTGDYMENNLYETAAISFTVVD